MPLDLSVESLGLRPSFVQALCASGIKNCYPWQAAALREAACPPGGSFVYTAPTSGGKSFVADVLMLQSLQRHISDWRSPRARALVIVPYLSIGAPVVSSTCSSKLPMPRVHVVITARSERREYSHMLCSAPAARRTAPVEHTTTLQSTPSLMLCC